jgi:hypothetical protein
VQICFCSHRGSFLPRYKIVLPLLKLNVQQKAVRAAV